MKRTEAGDKIQSISSTALIAVFLAFLCLPAFDSFWHLDPSPIPNEKRTLAKFPKYSGLAELAPFVAGLESYFDDHFGFRKLLVGWSNHWKLQLFNESPVDMAMVGRDGWLFWAADRMIDHYCGNARFSAQDLNGWQKLLENRRDYLARLGVKYIFVVAPDKHSIYPEYLPPWMVKNSQPSKLDQMLSYMKAHSTVQVLDFRPALLEAKKIGPLFLKTDTHWNALGAFIACENLVVAMAPQLPGLQPLPIDSFDRQMTKGHAGDLAVCLEQEHEMEETQYWSFTARPPLPDLPLIEAESHPGGAGPTRTITENTNATGKAVVFRDSFGEAWMPFLRYHFKEVIYVRSYEWDYSLLESKKPDVVIDEMVERLFNTQNPNDLLPKPVKDTHSTAKQSARPSTG